MTPQLQMAIKLLQLSRLELMDTIRTELEENPALEEIPESTSADHLVDQTETPSTDSSDAKEVTIEEKLQQDIDWSNYLDEYNTPGHDFGREPAELTARIAFVDFDGETALETAYGDYVNREIDELFIKNCAPRLVKAFDLLGDWFSGLR